MYLNGWARQATLLRMWRGSSLRELPLPVLWRLRRMLSGEKMVRIGDRTMVHSFLPPFPSRAFESMAHGLNEVRRGRAVPVSAYLAVTNRCSYACWHCSKAHRAERDLPLSFWRRAVRETQELGVAIVGITGGEPLQRNDLEEIVQAADSRSVTILFTSGAGFDEARAAALKRSGLFGVAVSLDHWQAGAHDERRGRPGAFDTALAAIRRARRLGFYTMIQLVATRDMLRTETQARYLDLARKLDVHEIRLLEPMPAGRLLEAEQAALLSAAERAQLRQWHLRANRRRGPTKTTAFAHIEAPDMYGCGAGSQHLYVDASGHVCPCDFTPVSFGNLREEPLADVWRRMGEAFGRPCSSCFLLRHAAHLREAFDGRLPIPYEQAKAICARDPNDPLPGFYRRLGKRGRRQTSQAESSLRRAVPATQ